MKKLSLNHNVLTFIAVASATALLLLASSFQRACGSDLSTIQSTIDAAYANKQPQVTVPPGTYTMTDPRGEGGTGSLLRFGGMKRNFTIDMTGVKLMVNDQIDTAILFEACSNITLRGVTLQRAVSPTSQGTVVNIDPNRMYVDIQIHTGYPTDYNDRFMERNTITCVNFFDPATKLLATGSRDATAPSSVSSLGNDRLRISFPVPIPGPLRIGEYAAWRRFVARDVDLINCAKMTVDEVTVRGGAGFAFHEINGMGGNRYSNDIVTFPPKPPGATIDPLLSTSADGFHSSCVRFGPTLTKCSFEGMDDDPINIHGVYIALGQIENNTTLDVALPWGSVPLSPGDKLDFIDSNSAYAGSATVVSVENLPNYTFTGSYPAGVPGFVANHTFWKRIVVSKPAPAGAGCGWLLGNRDAQGNGFRVQNCTFKNTRGRVLIKADGVIDGCTLQNMGGTLQVQPEFNANESGYVTDLVVSNNKIDDVGMFFGQWYALVGAVAIGAIEPREKGNFVHLPGGFRNIAVEDNTFTHNNGMNIEVTSAQGVTIKHNTFDFPMCDPSDTRYNRGMAPFTLIWLSDCNDIRFEGNTVNHPGPYMHSLVNATPTASVTGISSGIIIVTDERAGADATRHRAFKEPSAVSSGSRKAISKQQIST